jgi:hypothetical protein
MPRARTITFPADPRPLRLVSTAIAGSLLLMGCAPAGGDDSERRPSIQGNCNAQGDGNIVNCKGASLPPVRTPGQWAVEVEGACKRMEPRFDHDLTAMRTVDDQVLLSGDKKELARFAGILNTFYDHYTTLTSSINSIKPPSYSADSANDWRRLFNQRGTEVNQAISGVEEGGLVGRVQAASFFYHYSTLTDKVLAKAKQLGIESCP